MRKFFGLYDKEEENMLKEKLIGFTEIPHNFVHFLEIYVSNDEYIHVVTIDDTTYTDKKDLVLIHGLGGSSLNFFKIFKKFSKLYRIYAIDLPGMGCSSRHDFSHQNFQQVEDYFLEKIKFVLDKFNLKKFYLCGHSFGGYISTLFTIRHREMIEKLVLLSPVGLSSNYNEIESTKTEDFMQRVCFKMEKSPSIFFKLLGGVVSNFIFNKMCDHKFRGLKKREEFEVHRDFLYAILRNETSSEKAIFALFNKSLQPYKPITYYYEFLKGLPILILYGSEDWSPRSQAEDLQNLLINSVEIDLVSDSGHFLYTDNYQEMKDKILNFLLKEENKTEDKFFKKESEFINPNPTLISDLEDFNHIDILENNFNMNVNFNNTCTTNGDD